MPIAHGSNKPAAASSSDAAVTRTTGIGNMAIPVWPVAIMRSRLIVLLAMPEPRKTTARAPCRIHRMVSIPSRRRGRPRRDTR